ncbi:hypothetical protein P7C73_g2587, partial [Tremellales sp. Uapishka_1]
MSDSNQTDTTVAPGGHGREAFRGEKPVQGREELQGEKPAQVLLEFQNGLQLSPQVEEELNKEHAYVWKKDEEGNLLIRPLGDDPHNPRVWPNYKRYLVVGLACWLNNLMGEEFGFSSEIGTAGLSLYILIIFGAFLVIIYFGLPETRSTILLSKRSKRLRKATGQPIYGEHELAKLQPGHFYKVTIVRPFKFLVTEPITYLCAGINGLAYGIIFLSNEAFPLVFGAGNGGHGWTHSGIVNLTFLAYVVGSVLGFAFQPLQEAAYRRACAKIGHSDPEARWWTALWATPAMPLGLMIAAWTSYPTLPWIAPIIGFTLFGFGFYGIIAAILNYVVDGYGHYSASALGGVVFVRNIIGAAFPLFAEQMFVGLGNQYALFLISMVSFLLVPIPFYLYYKGKTVRAKSPYCAMHFGEE